MFLCDSEFVLSNYCFYAINWLMSRASSGKKPNCSIRLKFINWYSLKNGCLIKYQGSSNNCLFSGSKCVLLVFWQTFKLSLNIAISYANSQSFCSDSLDVDSDKGCGTIHMGIDTVTHIEVTVSIPIYV